MFDVDKFSAVGYADPPERGYQYYDVDGASRLARETVFLFQRQVHRTDPPRNNGLYKFNRTKKMYRFVSPVEEKLPFDPDHLNIDLPAEVEGDEEEEEGEEEGEEEEEEESAGEEEEEEDEEEEEVPTAPLKRRVIGEASLPPKKKKNCRSAKYK